MKLKKNDVINLNITSMTAQGSGVGRTDDGVVVFVPVSAVGDELEVRILKTKKTCVYGKIERIVSPSESRIEPDCPNFSKCGGCVYRHINYNSEKEIKLNRVKDAVERIGGLKNIKLNKVVGNDNTDRYRNKAQLPAGNCPEGVKLGFYAPRSHRIIPCEDCLLQPVFFAKIMDITRNFMRFTEQSAYDEKTRKGKLRHLYIRYAEATDELMICYVINGKGLKREDILIAALKKEFPNLKSVIFNSNTENTNVVLGGKNRVAYGSDYITDILCGKRFKLSLPSFYQVNRAQAEKLYKIVENYAASQGGLLLDLYCGTGTIGLSMAHRFREIIGVEIVEDTVKNARENAQINNIKNAQFICGDAAYAAEELRKNRIKPEVAVLDPPRKGCGVELVKTVAGMKPERIVYVSCDPETLARDLKAFGGLGYKTMEITPVDLFSRTAHIESAALLKRVK